MARKKQFANDDRLGDRYVPFPRRSPHLDYEYLSRNKDKFFETYCLLADDLSRRTMIAYLRASIKDDITEIFDVYDPNEYFNDITEVFHGRGGAYVDCGAYRGDSIENFIDWCKGEYTDIFGFEPDKKNFSELKKFVEKKSYKNVHLFNCGVCDEKKYSQFDAYGTRGSFISEQGKDIVEIDTIDNIVGDVPVGLIKMDIEGSELSALKGAINTLKKSRPVLAISAYHKEEDLITIPQFIKGVYGNCRLYLRQHEPNYLYELDFYVIPD